MKFTKKGPDGIVLTKEVNWEDKVQIAQLTRDKWTKVEEKAAPKSTKKKGTK